MSQVRDRSTLGEPDAEWLRAVEANGGEATDIGLLLDIAALRQFLESETVGKPPSEAPLAGYKQTDYQVPMRDGVNIACRVYRPDTPPQGGSPLLVIYHGGGWCVGDLSNEEPLCRRLSVELGMTCVNVDYRLAPEHQFPTAVNDSLDATKWAATNATTLGADPTQGFIVAGTSAGGNLCAVVAHLWRDTHSSPPLTGSHYMIPFFIHHTALPAHFRAEYQSWDALARAPLLSRKACDLFINNYAPQAASAPRLDAFDPLLSPLLFPSGRAGLPPAYFQVCGWDPLRDEALLFERLLREEEGIATRLDVYPGLPHGFWAILPELEASKRFVRDSVEGVRWLLEQRK